MANIVGLGPTQDQGNATAQQQIRPAAQLQDGLDLIKPVTFQPVATPVETYAHPQQAPINHDYENLIQGLSTLNGALDGYKSATATKKKEKVEIDKDALTQQYGGRSAEEIAQATASAPNKETASFLGGMRAAKMGDTDADMMQNYWNNNFDKTNGNILQEFDQVVAKRMATDFNGNPAGADAYMTRMAGARRSLMDQQEQFKKQNNDSQVSQAVQDGMTSIYRQAVDAGYPEHTLLNETSRYLGSSKELLGQPYKVGAQKALQGLDPLLTDMQQNPQKAAQIYDIARIAVEGGRADPKDGTVRRLADAPDGIGDAAKAKLAQFKEQYQTIIKSNTDNMVASVKYNVEKHPELVSDQQLLDMRNQGVISGEQYQGFLVTRQKANDTNAKADLELDAKNKVQATADLQSQRDYEQAKNFGAYGLTDTQLPKKEFFTDNDHNATTTLKADDRWQNIVALRDKDNAYALAQRTAKGENPDAVKQDLAGQDITFYSQNGRAPKQWGDQAKAAVNTLTTMSEQSGSVPQPAIDELNRYKMVKAQGANLLKDIYGERERQVLEVASNLPGEPAQSLQMAMRAYRNHDTKTDEIVAKDVKAEVDKTGHGWGAWLKNLNPWGNGEYPDNPGLLRDRVQKRAEAYVKAGGMTAADAIQQAVKDSASDFISVNGKMVEVGNRQVPANASDLAKDYLKQLDKTVGAQAFGADNLADMTLAEGPNGTFQVISKKHGYGLGGKVMLQAPGGEPFDARYITPQTFGVMQQAARSRAETKAVEAGANRDQPLFTIPGVGIGIPKPNRVYTREEMLQVQKNAKANDAARAARIGQQESVPVTTDPDSVPNPGNLKDLLPNRPENPVVGRGIHLKK